MDFTKFVSMLDSQALFFTRADKLGDPFEGSYSRGNERLRLDAFKEFFKGLPEEKVAQVRSGMQGFAKWFRNWVFVNCWHMNPGESAAMWKLYVKSNESVAIKSSFQRLFDVLDEEVFVGLVEYIDFERDWVPEGNSFYPFVHKRRSFAHEQEVRAVFQPVLPSSGESLDLTNVPSYDGVERKVALDRLIEEVYVAPTSPAWFKALVGRVTAKYGLTARITQSSLDANPFY